MRHGLSIHLSLGNLNGLLVVPSITVLARLAGEKMGEGADGKFSLRVTILFMCYS